MVVKLGHERVGRVVPEDRGTRHAVARRARGGPTIVGGKSDEELLRLDNLAS
jgi:hypothetical protein